MTPTPPSDSIHRSRNLDDAVAYRLNRTNRFLLTRLSRLLAQDTAALTPEKWFVLMRIAEREPVRQVDLTEPALADPPNISRLVDALVKGGWVERRASPTDRRSRTLNTTPEGRATVDRFMDVAVQERERIFGVLTPEQLASFTEVLDHIDEKVKTLLME